MRIFCEFFAIFSQIYLQSLSDRAISPLINQQKMNGQENENCRNASGENSAGAELERRNAGKNGRASGIAKTTARTYADENGKKIRRRAFRKNRHESETFARKEIRKIEILAAADAIAESAKLL